MARKSLANMKENCSLTRERWSAPYRLVVTSVSVYTRRLNCVLLLFWSITSQNSDIFVSFRVGATNSIKMADIWSKNWNIFILYKIYQCSPSCLLLSLIKMSMIAKNRTKSTWTPLSNEETNNQVRQGSARSCSQQFVPTI